VGEGAEAGRQLDDTVAVGHPDGHGGGQIGEDVCGGVALVDDGVAVLALAGGGDAAAELVGDELHTVADAEDGEAGVEDVGGGQGGAFVVDGGGAAGEDEAAGVKLLDLLPGGVEGDELAVDVTVTDSACDQHAILRAEIEDDDRFRLGRGWWFALAGLLTFALAGDLQVGGDLQVVGGRYPPIGGRATMSGIGGGFGFGHGAGCPPFAWGRLF
jgi:hypothetical protein